MTGKIEKFARRPVVGGGQRPFHVVERTGAEGRIDSIYLRDPDGNLVEIGVYPERTEKR